MAIEYQEKGAGLHAAIAAAGHWLMQRDGAWIASDDAAVQAIVIGYSLQQAKDWRCNEVALYAKVLRDTLMWLTSPLEAASWPLKLAEARAWATSGDATVAPTLAQEASCRGVALAAMCGLVLANAAALAPLEASIAGIDGAHRDAIRVLGSFEAVLAYDYTANWPAG
jgi:hypothetical protein